MADEKMETEREALARVIAIADGWKVNPDLPISLHRHQPHVDRFLRIADAVLASLSPEVEKLRAERDEARERIRSLECGADILKNALDQAGARIDDFLARADAAEARAEDLQAERDRMLDALEKIACFYDKGANARLANEGTYVAFDEPHSVKIARAALGGEHGKD